MSVVASASSLGKWLLKALQRHFPIRIWATHPALETEGVVREGTHDAMTLPPQDTLWVYITGLQGDGGCIVCVTYLKGCWHLCHSAIIRTLMG